ncbi:MAG TPA: YeiH family putative sulfate export transporter [Candidatus Galloscillospira stercoripullorum]|nr:YeiH family putative sulfate export transporter [Candidatus Galloscillospira stercoripullorum]
MNFVKKNGWGIVLCLAVAVPSWFLGKAFPIIGGAVIAILAGMVLSLLIQDKSRVEGGVKFVSKKVLQWAVVLLGFGMNLNVVVQTGKQSLPIILCTISVSLITAFLLSRCMRIPGKVATLVGVGSSICGGSAIAATAPVIEADEEEVAQAISVIFFFNVLAALIFPSLGQLIGFDTSSGEAFGIFAGTAVNDTSSVTATAATWDSMWNLGTATLDKAVTVKLTRTLAIIPITLVLAFLRTRRAGEGKTVDMKKIFPFFILFFIGASVITAVAVNLGADAGVFDPVKELSKFLIVLAMAAIGVNTNIVKLVKSGGKPLALGACCWVAITAVSLLLQWAMGLI